MKGITVFFNTHLMEEAERMADRVGIIDYGKIVAQGTPEELKNQTETTTLEQAFLSFTGRAIRDEEASSVEQMKTWRRIHMGRQ